MRFSISFAAVAIGAMSAILPVDPPACAAPGTVIWEATYSSRPGQDDDRARGLAIDGKGELAVVGYVSERPGNYDYITIKYGPYGTTEWVREFDHSWYDVGRAVAMDSAGNVVVAGASNNLENPRDSYSGAYYTDYRIIKYSPAGDPLQELTASGYLKNNEPSGVALGRFGSIYVTGTAKNASDAYTLYYTVKFSPSGELLWSRMEDWGAESYATGIRLDPDGNAVVAGYYKDLETGRYAIRAVRYDVDGYRLKGELTYKSYNSDVKAWGLAVDSEGDVIITGETSEDGGAALTMKYSPTGELLWAAKYTGSEYKNRGNAVAVDPDGRVYVAGRTFKEDQTGDFLLLVYSKDGRLADARTYPFGGESSAADIVLDIYGNIVIAGTTIMPGQPGIIRTVRIEGYQPRKASSPGPKITLGTRAPDAISLAMPAMPMLRKVELYARRADPKDPDSAFSVIASPVAAPGEYEYRFSQLRASTRRWEPLTDYTFANHVQIRPDPQRPVKVMVEVRARGSSLSYEAKEELDLHK
jgi:uncharacterized delta-60 repeat protein